MGKRKYESINTISNDYDRHITKNKRIKGLIKKAIELSTLCE